MKNRKIGLWLYVLTIVIGIIITISSMWGVWLYTAGKRDKSRVCYLLNKIAQLPNSFIKLPAKETVFGVNKSNQKEKLWLNENYTDTGFVLISGFDKEYNQTVVKLIRLSDKHVINTWMPDIDDLNKRALGKFMPESQRLANSNFKVMHPFLTKDTGLIIKGEFGLYKMSKTGNIVWSIDGWHHHSTEEDADGNLWICGLYKDKKFDKKLYPNLRDDAIVKISVDGKVLYKKSVTSLLIENGYYSLLFGAGQYEEDITHLNDIQPALYDGPYWKKGDLLISIRERSTIFLYRPSTNKVLWLKTGPWMNQHDVNFIDSTRITVINNYTIRHGDDVLPISNTNQMLFFDFKTNTIDSPFTKFFKTHNICTATGGRTQLIDDSTLFVEESLNGRIFKGTNNQLHWSYVEIIDNKKVGVLQWSRYYTKLPWQ